MTDFIVRIPKHYIKQLGWNYKTKLRILVIGDVLTLEAMDDIRQQEKAGVRAV